METPYLGVCKNWNENMEIKREIEGIHVGILRNSLPGLGFSWVREAGFFFFFSACQDFFYESFKNDATCQLFLQINFEIYIYTARLKVIINSSIDI